MRMENNVPARKVMASTIGAALTTLLIFAYDRWAGSGDPLPVHVMGALNVIVVFLAGYFVPPSPNDGIVPSTGAREVQG